LSERKVSYCSLALTVIVLIYTVDDQQAIDLIDERERTGDPNTPNPLVLADGFEMMELFGRPETREFFLGL
jgi:hypothetical protein